MRKLLFSFFVSLLPFKLISATTETILSSSEARTVLKDGTPYKITLSGTYVITTENQRISSRIHILNNLTVTLILEDCKIAPNNSLVSSSNSIHYGAPIVIGGDNCSLTLQFKGCNELGCASDFSTVCFASAITLLPKTRERTISVVIEEAKDAPAGSSLSLYGRNVSNSVAYSPIYLPPSYTLNEKTYSVDSSVTLQRGKIHFYTTDLRDKPYLSPAITATTVSLSGADVTLTIAPYNTNDLTSALTTWENVINDYKEQSKSPLFDCTTFRMTRGSLSTQGERWPKLTETINKYTTNNYGTTYGYPSELFILPGEPTGGVVAKQTSTTFYGFNLASTENLAACFTNTTDKTEITSSGGMVEVGVANAEAVFADASVDIHQATAASNIFNIALTPTSKGFVLEKYDFGILKIGPSATDTIELVVALDLPDVTADVPKTFTLEILCDGESIYRGEVTLERQSETTRFMCTVTTEALFQATTAGTRKYTIRAMRE